LQKNQLPKTEENRISEKQFVGYRVIDVNLGNIGTIRYINSQTAQQLIYFEKGGEEFCFPWHKQFVKSIDTEKEEIRVELPEELLDLN